MSDGKRTAQHQLIWLMVYGEKPKRLRHINGNRTDNRIDNLVDVDVMSDDDFEKILK